jgi:hypothetical protein
LIAETRFYRIRLDLTNVPRETLVLVAIAV